jgi:hypothetical protein
MFCFRKYWKAGMLFLILSLLPIWNLGFSLDLDAPRPVYAGTCPHDPEGGGPSGVTLDECVTSAHFIAYYTTDAADGSHRILSEAQAQFVVDNLELAWDRYVNDVDFAFRIPKNTDVEPLEVWIHDISGLGVTNSSWNRMSLDAAYVRGCDPVGSPTSGNCLQSKATPLHELLHRVQYKYTGFSEEKTTAGNFAVEGHAKFMEDEVFADLDGASGTQYQLRSNGYLGNPNWDVTTASYNACFFWKYFTERYGTATDEPERGVDAIRHFWNESEVVGVGGIGTVNLALDSLGHPAVTFHSVFRDWIVANYTKDLGTVPAAKYGYIDDDGNPYSSVHKTVDVSVAAGDYSTSANQAVDRWGAKYYRVRPTATCGAVSFDFERDSGTPVYHVLTIKDDELVEHWTSTSSDWSKTVVNDDYDEVVGIVGGYGTDTQVDVSYGCADLYVDIVDPTTLEPAFVGSILDPEKFLVRLEVTSTQSIKIEGLNAQDFDITVGTQAADIVLGAYIQSQYWLLVQAPIQTTAGDYNLTAAYGSASDTENAAVKYITVVHDDMLVVDRSGSMLLDGKLDAAKNAARLYTDATANGNMLGLTSFGEDATLDYGLAVVDSTVRSDVKNAIVAITTTLPELTSIGDGLSTGLADLELNGDGDHPCTVVLLSDGVQTAPSYWNDVKTGVIDSPCVVDTIALGPDTDEALLQEIANLTSGNYYYVPDENATLRVQGVGQAGSDWRNELAGTYEFAQGDVAGRSRMFEVSGEVGQATGPVTHTIEIEDDVTEAVFFVNLAYTNQTEYIDLYRPDGYEIMCEEPGVRCVYDRPHILYHVMTPTLQSGVWTMVIHPGFNRVAATDEPGATLQNNPYLAGASGNTHLTLHPFLGAPLASRLQGVRMPVLAALAGQAPILGATISAAVMGPNGLFQTFPLFDDGEHGDGAANDGLYGNWFPLSIGLNSPGGEEDGLEGSYRVKFETDGVAGKIGARYAQLGFAIEKDADNDGDGMPNLWEDANGLDKNVDDADEDPDLDALDNLGEYNNGTDPHDSDTDGGGENDGSEVDLFGQDPFDPADDEIEAIEFVNASPHISATVLTFGVDPDYDRLRLFRSTSPDSGYLPVQENVPVTGAYTDTGLTNDTTYYYKMMAVDGDGHRSAVGSAGAATPKADPFPPTNVGVLINDGAISTSLRGVTLHFFFEEPGEAEDVAEVMVSNDAAFTGATWVSYTETLSWTLSSTLQYSDTAEVFVRFRDAALNESPDVAGDSILYLGHSVYLPVVLRNDTP